MHKHLAPPTLGNTNICDTTGSTTAIGAKNANAAADAKDQANKRTATP